MIGVATELLDLVARWIHVIAGIMWIGNSLLFNWLDRNLVDAPSTADSARRTGQVWLLHSGGFYFVEKTLLPGQRLPAPLHWFKWQAYTTWLTGLALLVIVYWAGGRAVMADASVRDLSPGAATAVGIASVFGGWLVYELANRFVAPRAPAVASAIWVAVLAAISFALTELLAGRAAFIHVGAMLGTIMAGNVFFTIVPSQHELVRSVQTGLESAAADVSARAKRVSIHNNYFTFPVLALMVSSHFPVLYSGAFPWATLAVLIAGGALSRHALNIRFTNREWGVALGATIIGTLVGLAALAVPQPGARNREADTGPVAFADVRSIIDRRCTFCHSTAPLDPTFGPAPGGAAFDSPAQIAGLANRIHERAVVTRTMPPSNRTRITDDERALIRRWFTQGAPVH